MKMWCRLAGFCLIIISCRLSNAAITVQNQGPCNFMNTVNITGGHLDQNGNYHFKGTVYKNGTFDLYNYIVENLTEVVEVEPHFRGCLCDNQPCIRICCTSDNNNNSACVSSDTLVVPTYEAEGEEIDWVTGRRYGVLFGKPCKEMYKLEPLDYPDDKWYFVVST